MPTPKDAATNGQAGICSQHMACSNMSAEDLTQKDAPAQSACSSRDTQNGGTHAIPLKPHLVFRAPSRYEQAGVDCWPHAHDVEKSCKNLYTYMWMTV